MEVGNGDGWLICKGLFNHGENKHGFDIGWDGFKAWMFPVGVKNHMAAIFGLGSLTSSRRRPSRSLPPIAQQRLRRWVMVMVPFLSLKCL
jgi:hypothetical protein